MKRKQAVAGIFAALSLTAFGVGCGSDDNSSSESAAPAAGSTETQSAATGANSEIAAAVEKLQARPTSIGIDAPIEKGIAKGKKIAVLECGVPACKTIVDATVDAVKTVGWTPIRVNIGLTPESVKAGWEKALNDKPDGIITTGSFPRALFKPELAQAKSENIPVVTMSDSEPASDGVVASISGSERATEVVGPRMADWIISKTDGKAKILKVTASALATITLQFEGFDARIKEQCPDCSVVTYDAPATSIGKDLASKIASQLQANPDVNYIALGFNDMGIGLPAAIAGAGVPEVPAVTQSQSAAISQYISKGQGIEAAYGFPGIEGGWRMVDALIRHFNGESVEPSEQNDPEWFITKDNVPSTTEDYPLVEDYKEQYKALWGVS